MKIMPVVIAALMAGYSAYATAEDGDAVDFVFGGGLVFSPGYDDFVDDVYGSFYDTSGGEGWLDLYGGLEIRTGPQFSFLIGCDVLMNAVEVDGGPLDEDYGNLILVPSVYGQLYFTESRMVYVNAGINLPLPATGSDYFDFKNNGVGIGVNVGFAPAEVFRIEGGLTYLPVTVEATSDNPVYATGAEEDYNFGGVQIRALLVF